ncbi:MAG: hypothetical protein GY838_10580 [bacterium]|nr:hypothetical protein [bacterium]
MIRTALILVLLLMPLVAAAVEHVDNPAEPTQGRFDVTLREVWRVGGEDGDVFFGLVPRVETDQEGNVHILDSQLCQVSVYDPRGNLLRTLFREGDGPGEVRRPRDMVVLDDGRVGLVQEFPGQISFVGAQGDPAGRAVLGGTDGGIHSLTACAAAGDRVLVSGTHQVPNDHPSINLRVNFLELCDDQGVVSVQYASNETQYDFADFHFIEREHLPPFWWAFAASSTGTVYTVSDRDNYRVEAFAADGTALRTFGRAYEALDRTADEHAKLKSMVLSAFNGAPFQPTIVIEQSEEVVASMHRGLQVRPDGELWVLTGRGVRPGQPGVMAVFDVFDDEGVFVRQMALRAPHDGRDVGIFLSGEDRIIVVKGYFESLAAQFGNGATFAGEDGEAETPEIICYEMVR